MRLFVYIMVLMSAAALMGAGPISNGTGWYDAEDNPGRTVWTAGSGYPRHDVARDALAYKSDGTPCAIWLADAGRYGTRVAYGCYDVALHRVVGEKNPLRFDIVFGYGRSKPVGLVMLPGDIPVIVATESPLLQPGPPVPVQLKLARFNPASGEWEGFQGVGYDTVGAQSCAGSYGCLTLSADLSYNPVTGWFGVAWMDGMVPKWTDFDGVSYQTADPLGTGDGNLVRPSAVIDTFGIPRVVLAGTTITGRGAGVVYLYRQGGTWSFERFPSIAVYSADVAVDSTGTVAIAYGSAYYPNTWLSVMTKPSGGWYWTEDRPGLSQVVGYLIGYNAADQLEVFWYDSSASDILAKRRFGQGDWRTFTGKSGATRVTNDPQSNRNFAVGRTASGKPGLVYQIGSSHAQVGYTHWVGP